MADMVINMRYLFTYIVLTLTLAGCGASKHFPVDAVRDSVSVVVKESVIYRDSIIYVEVPAETDKAILPVADTSHLETSLAVSDAWVTDGRLNHTLSHKQERLAKVITMPVYLRSEQTEHLSHQVVVKEVEKQLNWWQSFRMSIGTIALIVVLVWLVLMLIKRFLLRV